MTSITEERQRRYRSKEAIIVPIKKGTAGKIRKKTKNAEAGFFFFFDDGNDIGNGSDCEDKKRDRNLH